VNDPERGKGSEAASKCYVIARAIVEEEVEDDDEPFEEKMQRLTQKLEEQFAQSVRLEAAIRQNLKALGM
jgi:type I restriction enzyme M protein